MAKVTVYKQDGSKTGDIELNDSVFAITPNNFAITDAVLMQRASMRQGTHATKNRSAVSGGGRKPWRQKGTGRARQGSIRAPQWRGGGVVNGPMPRDYSYRINRKQYQLALKSILSQKVADEKLLVVDQFDYKEPKTKEFANNLSKFDVSKKTLVVVEDENMNTVKSARNIDKVKVLMAKGINVLDLVNAEKVIIAKSAVEQVQEVLS